MPNPTEVNPGFHFATLVRPQKFCLSRRIKARLCSRNMGDSCGLACLGPGTADADHNAAKVKDGKSGNAHDSLSSSS